jgi:hypothetical protein
MTIRIAWIATLSQSALTSVFFVEKPESVLRNATDAYPTRLEQYCPAGSICFAEFPISSEVLPLRPIWILLLWLWAAGAGAVPLRAQQSDPVVRGVERVNFSVGGIGIYRPEAWGAVKISLRNAQDREVNLLATTHFQGDPTLQYGRRFWMPPQSRMVIWHPIRMPAAKAANPGSGNETERFFELQSQVMNTEGDTESLVISDTGALHFDQSLRIADDSPTTAVIGKPSVQESIWSVDSNPYDVLLTARYEQGMNRNLAILGDEQAPAGEEVLGALDQLVIFDDRLLNDLAGITAIRRWVVGGGKLWIMADQVRPELLTALLGDDASLSVVDTVELTHVKVVPATTKGTVPFERQLDKPVPMVRVLGDGFTPAFLCDDWPAAFWKSYGAGRILVTTLGPDGWIRPRLESDPPPESGNFKTTFFPGQPLVALSAEFFVKQPAPALPVAAAEQNVQALIGYRIPSRGLVVGSLLGFTALIVGGGVWLSRRGQLERLGLAIPLFSLIIAGVLLGAGMQTRSEIPSDLAAVQLVQSVPGTEDVRLTGSTGIFTRDDGKAFEYRGNSGGWGVPDMTGLEGTTRRLVWNDIDQWSWEKLSLKPGLRTMLFQSASHVDRPVRASASFMNGALTGRLQLPDGLDASDAILATSTGRIGLTVSRDGRWSVAQEQLGPSQFLAATVLSDEQQLRNQLMSRILVPSAEQLLPPVPTIYAWTKPWSQGLVQSDSAPIGSAVVAVPVEWLPIPPGTTFTIPQAFLTYREIRGPDGSRPSGFYDSRARQFVEKSGPNSGWVAFEIHPELLPLQTRKVDVTFRVTGPMGRLELSAYQDGQLKSLRVWQNPVGTLQHTVEDGSLMPIDPLGRMLFRVDAGTDVIETPLEAEDKLSNPMTYWQFVDISARITAEVPDDD